LQIQSTTVVIKVPVQSHHDVQLQYTSEPMRILALLARGQYPLLLLFLFAIWMLSQLRIAAVIQALRILIAHKTTLRFSSGGFPPVLKLVPILVSTGPQVPPAEGRRPLLLVELSFKVADQRLIRGH
jgi:hypothetical protein